MKNHNRIKLFFLGSVFCLLAICRTVFSQADLSPEEKLNQLIDNIVKKYPPRLAPVLIECIGKVFPLVEHQAKNQEPIKVKFEKLMVGCMLQNAAEIDEKAGIAFEKLSTSSDQAIQNLFSILSTIQQGSLPEKAKTLLGPKADELANASLSIVHEKVFEAWLAKLPSSTKALFEQARLSYENSTRSFMKTNVLASDYDTLAAYTYYVKLIYDYQKFINLVTSDQACLATRIDLPPSCQKKKICQNVSSIKQGVKTAKTDDQLYQYACLDQDEWSLYFAEHVDKSLFNRCGAYKPDLILLQPVVNSESATKTTLSNSTNDPIYQDIKAASKIFLQKVVKDPSAIGAAESLLRWAALTEQLRVGHYLLGESILDISIPEACRDYKEVIQSTALFVTSNKQEPKLDIENADFLDKLHKTAKELVFKINDLNRLQSLTGLGGNGQTKISRLKSEIVQIFLRYPYLLGGYISKRDKHFEDFLVHPEQVFFANIRSKKPKFLQSFAKEEDVSKQRELMKQVLPEIQEQFYEQMQHVCQSDGGYNVNAMMRNSLLKQTITSEFPTLNRLYECINDQIMIMEKNKKFLKRALSFGCPSKLQCLLSEGSVLLVESYFAYQNKGAYLNPGDVRSDSQKQEAHNQYVSQVQQIQGFITRLEISSIQMQSPLLAKILAFLN